MIDEKKLIEKIDEMFEEGKAKPKNNSYDFERWQGMLRAYFRVKDEIEKMPKLGEWIPVSERLPDKKGLYLVSHGENYSVCIEEFNGIRHFSTIHNYSQPIAWMPLPEPYKGDEE